MSDRVFVRNLAIFGKHGLFRGERELGQRFEVDIDCHLDLEPAGRADDYDQTVCYQTLCDLSREVIEGDSVNLVETLAEHVASAVLARWPRIERVTIAIRKPSAPLGVVVDHVGVEITRHRKAPHA